MLTRFALASLGVAALAARADASTPSCSTNGFAKKHGDYIAGVGPCTINADNYYTDYLDADYPATSTTTRYTNILADFAGAGTNGNLKKLTANRVGACPNLGGVCSSSFWEGDDPTAFPDNEMDSWANVALYNPAKDNGKLLVFFAGSPVRPKAYIDFGLRAAHAGYHVILLSYVVYGATGCMGDWAVPGWSWTKGPSDTSNPDTSPSVDECISEVIGYVADGKAIRDPYWADFNLRTPGTNNADSAHNRVKLLLYYLQQNFQDQGWDKFLQRPCAGNLCGPLDVNWAITAVAAHSMGTQLATYFETKFALDRVIMLAGPHPHLETTASLHAGDAYVPTAFSTSGATAVSKRYALLHEDDPNFPYQLLNHMFGLGLIYWGSGYDAVTYVDQTSVFTSSSHMLHGTADASLACPGSDNPAHNLVGGTCGNGEYQDSWDFMLKN